MNEVQRAYNGLGQLVREWQSHAGAVNPVTTPSVQYAYTEALDGNHSRPESMTYPGGAEVVFGYGSGVDDAISRLTTVADGANTVEVMLYLGLGTVVMRTHAESGVNLSYLKQSGEADGDAGDRYTGLDRFGRIVDQRWANSSNTDLDRNQYGYDRAGNRLFKDNTVISDLSEQYAYDALAQLTNYQQGTPGDAVTRTQSWDLNPLGNWSTVTTDGVDQIRTHNAQNEITNIGETTTITYDANGNLTTDENDYRFGWDAWNRLVQVRDASNAVVARYGRDALGRRITVEQGETVTDRYFSSPWQLLEESIDGSTVTRHVWSPVYVDALVLRDRDTDGNGTLDERLYPLQDANWNVTALVTLAETVVERYSYDPYGQVTVRDASGDVIAGSAKDWLFLHQGGEQIAAGDYDFRNRAYSPTLGRWLSNDPIGFDAGDNNWYRYEGNDPGNGVDPEGLFLDPGTGSIIIGGITIGSGISAGAIAGGAIVGGVGFGIGYCTSKWLHLGDSIGKFIYPINGKPLPQLNLAKKTNGYKPIEFQHPNYFPNPRPIAFGDISKPPDRPKDYQPSCQWQWENDSNRCLIIATNMKRIGSGPRDIAPGWRPAKLEQRGGSSGVRMVYHWINYQNIRHLGNKGMPPFIGTL